MTTRPTWSSGASPPSPATTPSAGLIRVDNPNGTYRTVEFDPWHQVSSDENDTVLASAWYAARPGRPARRRRGRRRHQGRRARRHPERRPISTPSAGCSGPSPTTGRRASTRPLVDPRHRRPGPRHHRRARPGRPHPGLRPGRRRDPPGQRRRRRALAAPRRRRAAPAGLGQPRPADPRQLRRAPPPDRPLRHGRLGRRTTRRADHLRRDARRRPGPRTCGAPPTSTSTKPASPTTAQRDFKGNVAHRHPPASRRLPRRRRLDAEPTARHRDVHHHQRLRRAQPAGHRHHPRRQHHQPRLQRAQPAGRGHRQPARRRRSHRLRHRHHLRRQGPAPEPRLRQRRRHHLHLRPRHVPAHRPQHHPAQRPGAAAGPVLHLRPGRQHHPAERRRPADHLLRQPDRHTRAPTTPTTPSTASPDAAGREHIGQTGQPQTTWDDAARADVPLPTDGQAMRTYTETYAYDPVGNFQSVVHTAANGNWTRTLRLRRTQQPARPPTASPPPQSARQPTPTPTTRTATSPPCRTCPSWSGTGKTSCTPRPGRPFTDRAAADHLLPLRRRRPARPQGHRRPERPRSSHAAHLPRRLRGLPRVRRPRGRSPSSARACTSATARG